MSGLSPLSTLSSAVTAEGFSDSGLLAADSGSFIGFGSDIGTSSFLAISIGFESIWSSVVGIGLCNRASP